MTTAEFSAIVVAIVTLGVLIATYLITQSRNEWERHAAQRILFEQFNKRFDNLNEDLNNIYALSQTGADITNSFQSSVQAPRARKWEDVVQDYLNLCSEEYLWHKKKLIDEEIWTAWKAGIDYYLQAPAIRLYFENQKPYSVSYYGILAVIM